ncbi:bcl-2-like protein 1 [Mercenaria mercenaria]|uniref:bcl-2-like protein 1 n=1 Tax=Mercenaria mercenaria TaxID=6596 RepID=UPI00234F06AC|nr:bcl-2-like protein 1 [Mercenaria mercenaria]
MKMEEDDFSIGTSSIMAEYISYKIQKAGYNWQVSPTRNCPENKVINTVKKLCGEFEKRYEKQFSEMCLACAEVDLNSNNYMGVLDQLIVDGLHWGRVVAIFSFAGAMSVYCMENGKTERVDWIREWTCQFLDNKVENWINENNGWKGIVDFYTNGAQKPEERGNGWGSVIIGGALGAFAIGALIINKA